MSKYDKYFESKRFSVPNSFKDDKSKYLQTVGPLGMWMMDIIYFNQDAYILLINVNSRFVKIYPTSKSPNGSEIANIIKNAIMADHLMITHLKFDGEKTFNSNILSRKLFNLGIIISPAKLYSVEGESTKQVYHGSLALLDRFVRTLRDILYNYKLSQTEENIKFAVRQYNIAPHESLTKIFVNFVKKHPNFKYKLFRDNEIPPISPLFVENNFEVKMVIIEETLYKNHQIKKQKDFKIPVGKVVKIKESHKAIGKRRRIAKPDPYIVVGYNGSNHIVKNRINGETISVPRCLINVLR